MPDEAEDRFMIGCGLLIGLFGVGLYVWPAVLGWLR